MVDMKVEEICLKLTFGIIAGKWWGSKGRRPIIALHGWQDNAGSFDALIPQLSPEFSYFAIDLPGHGFSSHFPNGYFYNITDMASILEEIRSKYNWEKISVIAHSMGVLVAFMYASLFPMHVDLICALDTLKPVNFSPVDAALLISTRLNKLYRINSCAPLPAYTYDEIKERIYEGSLKSLDRDKVELLMKRGIKPSINDSNKFQLTRDIRIKYIHPLFISQEIIMQFIKTIQAAYLFIKTDDCTYDEPSEIFSQTLEQFQKYNQRFEMIRVNGTHHEHLNNPTAIAPKINEFLAKFYIPNGQNIQSKL